MNTPQWLLAKRIRYATVGVFLLIYFCVCYLILIHLVEADRWAAPPKLP